MDSVCARDFDIYWLGIQECIYFLYDDNGQQAARTYGECYPYRNNHPDYRVNLRICNPYLKKVEVLESQILKGFLDE